MNQRPSNPFVRIGVAVAALGLLCAFSYPLVQEGYQRLGSSVYKKAQKEILQTSVASYLSANPNVNWDTSTSTLQILTDLETGVDRDFDGINESFIASSTTPDELANNYRIVYKSPESFKVVIR